MNDRRLCALVRALAVLCLFFGCAVADGMAAETPGNQWNPLWPYYRQITLSEKYGLERSNEPVEITLSLPSNQVKDPTREVRVVEVLSEGVQKEIPSQVFDVLPTEKSFTFTVAFLVDIAANSSKVYLIFYGNPEAPLPSYDTDLKVVGAAPNPEFVENAFYRIGLDKDSGQLSYITPKNLPDQKFTFYVNKIHINPDAYVPGRTWGHTVDWNPPPNYAEVRGPILFRTKRWGPMPRVPEVETSVTYTFYVNCPYVKVQSEMEVVDNVSLLALRDNELAFQEGTFTDAAWRNKQGQLGQAIMVEADGKLNHARFAMVEADAPWVALSHRDLKVGVASINKSVLNSNKLGSNAPLIDPYTYISAPGMFGDPKRDFQYFSRWYITVKDVVGEGIIVPKGSVYASEDAFLLFELGPDQASRYSWVDYYHARLNHPLHYLY